MIQFSVNFFSFNVWSKIFFYDFFSTYKSPMMFLHHSLLPRDAWLGSLSSIKRPNEMENRSQGRRTLEGWWWWMRRRDSSHPPPLFTLEGAHWWRCKGAVKLRNSGPLSSSSPLFIRGEWILISASAPKSFRSNPFSLSPSFPLWRRLWCLMFKRGARRHLKHQNTFHGSIMNQVCVSVCVCA